MVVILMPQLLVLARKLIVCYNFLPFDLIVLTKTGLLEEKGVHHEAGPPKPDADSKSSSKDDTSGGKEKLSLKDKIKAKLHKH
jgi:hypothetical protein